MKLAYTRLILCLALLLSTSPENLFAQDYHFAKLTSEDGLSSNIVQFIKKDSRGYLWIGCNNALNRYNGSTFTKFVYNPDDSTSITSGATCCIVEDRNNTLWIATKDGLSIFNYKTEKFKRIFNAEDENTFIKNLYITSKDELFIVTTKGLYKLDKKQNKFEKLFRTLIDQEASVMIEDSSGDFYFGTWGRGIIYWDSIRNDYFTEEITAKNSLNDENNIESLAIDRSGKLWIGTRNGFYVGKIEKVASKIKLNIDIVRDKNGNPWLGDTKIHSLVFDDNNKLWVGTENGLGILDTNTLSQQMLYAKKSAPEGLNNNLINCLFNDPNNGIWVGTYQGGVNFYSKGNTPFNDRIPFISQSDDAKIRYVKSVYQEPDGKLWIGTDYGLLQFSKEFQLEKTYSNSSEPGSLSVGGVTAIYSDKENNLWVGTWGGGVNRMDKRSGKFQKYSNEVSRNTTDSTLTGDSNIRSFIEDSKGFLWVVCMFGVIDRYNPKTKSFRSIDIAAEVGRPNMEIKSVDIDKDDNLWIGTTGTGLIKLDTKSFNIELIELPCNDEFSNDRALGSNIYSVHIDRLERMWLGTDKGVCLFNPITREFTNYSTSKGLNSEMVLGVVSDNNGNIWISTLKGISKLDTHSGYFSNFDIADGVISNAEVASKNKEGTLFFAGVNGITCFNPDSIWTNQQVPPVVLSDFRLFDKSIVFDKKLMPEHIDEIKEIELKYYQNSFTIVFAALNFIHPAKNVYSCILSGFNTEWNYLGAQNEMKYTNLNPGTYFFKVKAANNSGVWNNNEKILKIIIKPPWWKTLVFRILIVVLIVTLTGVVIKIRTLQLEHQKAELLAKVNERTLEIEKQKTELKKQAEALLKTNSILVMNQKEIEQQKEAILNQKNKLEEKNLILEEQKEKILQQQKLAEAMSKQLHEADIRKIKFLTNISHEFRTPLSLIFSPLEKSLREFKHIDKNKLYERLKLMFRNTVRLLRLINEFLDISKIEEGLLKMNLGKGSIHDFTLGIIEAYSYLSEQKNIRFRFVSELEHVSCFFDAEKVDKIINNLLSNAFKYTQSEGEITVRLIAISKDENNEIDYFQISVEDTGIGIEEEFKSKIYERFYQIDTNKEQASGTGIGLALTRELIFIYGGKVNLESEPGKGSKFAVTLPCSPKYFKADEIKKDLISNDHKTSENYYSSEFTSLLSDSTENTDFSNKKATVLLVEDNKDIVQFIQDQFSEEFNFVFSFDGLSGFQKAVAVLPQAILLDVMMPKMNGFELCEKLKKDERTCHIPIIFLTALADKSEQIEGLEYGADDYITKPFDVDLLKAKVLNLIETRKKLKLLYQKKLSFESFETTPESSDEKLLKRIMKVVNKELVNSAFGVEELSKEVGLSRTHLYRKLLEITQQTPVEFIRNIRLAKAANLLEQNKFYVSEVAFMTGFSEISYFRKIFKDFYGVTPSDYAAGKR